jgi:carbamoyltransferase
MYILGITSSDESGAALMKDGHIVAAINEERLSRVKLDDAFPVQSIAYVLAHAGIDFTDVDVVSYAWHSGFDYRNHLHDFVSRCVDISEQGSNAKRVMLERIAVEVERDTPHRDEFDQYMVERGFLQKVESFDHHLGHAATAYYPSPYENALVFTLDARGNFRSGGVFIGTGHDLKEISCNYTFDSMGFLYGQVTELLGFKPHRHEGKVTGLAAYGNPEKTLPIFRNMIGMRDGNMRANLESYYKPFFYQQHQALKDELAPFSKEDIAAGLQRHLEDVVTEYISHYVRMHKIGNIAVAGGVFANVKLNQRIRAIPGVEDLFVFPNMGDGGLSVGACYLSWHARSPKRSRMRTVYFGTEQTDEDITTTASRYADRVLVTQHDHESLVRKTIEMLRKNMVVGLFQGRMEFGPRALGNRTILYHARDKEVNNWLNKRLHRTEFMPFAPVTTAALAPRCFVGWKPSHMTTNFMTECYDCTEEMIENSPAVVHVDGTARPQILERDDNPLYYDIIDAWYKETGGLCLVNTSFNEHEQPIVCTIDDALKSQLNNNVDVIVANGSYVIEKKQDA